MNTKQLDHGFTYFFYYFLFLKKKIKIKNEAFSTY